MRTYIGCYFQPFVKYARVALLSALFLGEPITPKMWAGTVLILIGVVLLTPPQ